MTYCLYDANGLVGELGSYGSLSALRHFVLEVCDSAPVRNFFLEGVAPVTTELMDGFKALFSEDESIQSSIDGMIDLLEKCDSVAIINEDEEGEG